MKNTQFAAGLLLMLTFVGVMAAAISLGEPLGMKEFAAMALTLVGVAMALRAPRS